MVPWWKRLVYSLAATMVGGAVCGAGIGANEYLATAHGYYSGMALVEEILVFDSWMVLLCFPGWLAAVPMVLLVQDVSRWRFWAYWAAGACFGPALVVALALFDAVRAPDFEGFPQSSLSVVWTAGATSALTSLVYLLLLRRARNREEYVVGAAAI